LEQGTTVGQYLQRQRENHKISLESISQGTRIKSAFLQALEEDAFHLLPAETYVRDSSSVMPNSSPGPG